MQDVLGNTKTVLEQLTEQAVQANRSAYAAVKSALHSGQRLVWGNINGIEGQGPTPEEAVTSLGVTAAKWFKVAATSSQLITLLDGVAPQIMPEGWTYVINADGTVTLTRPA